MALEIERKFRIHADPSGWKDARFLPLAAWEVWQGYLSAVGIDPEVRIRLSREIAAEQFTDVAPRAMRDDEGNETVMRWLVVKKAIQTATTGALSRREVAVTVTEAQFTEAWDLCDGRLRKIRVEYIVNFGGAHRPLVVDTFVDRLHGLVIGEVEFQNWKEARDFQPPSFLGPEVTHDDRYSNVSLAYAGAPPP